MVVAHSSKQARAIYARLSELDQDISCELILHDEGTKESRRTICENFKKDESDIDILVVYNMLLTGFDAHRLKKLYLCRPIKAHNLLQALTRVLYVYLFGLWLCGRLRRHNRGIRQDEPGLSGRAYRRAGRCRQRVQQPLRRPGGHRSRPRKHQRPAFRIHD